MKTFKEFLTEQQLLEMANAPKSATGCPCIMWIQVKGNNSGSHNKPRVKFQNNKSDNLQVDQLVPISIEDNLEILPSEDNYDIKLKSKELDKIKEWIIINKELLLKHWNGKITSYEVFSQCKKV